MTRTNSRRNQILRSQNVKEQYEKRNYSQLSRNFRLVEHEEIKIELNEVWGYSECKKDLSLLVDFLNDKSKFDKFNIHPPLKYVLSGTNGSGKKTLACAVAKMAKRPIIIIEPSFFYGQEVLEELDEIFSLINENFILLFKNIESICELPTEISQPLIESLIRHFRDFPNLVAFATFESEEEVYLSSQLFEKPAFEKMIELPFHELSTREKIVEELLRDIPVDSNIDVHRIALDSYGMTTGQIKRLIKEASLICLKNKNNQLSYADISEALAQLDYGTVNSSLSPEERKMTAIHEAGHVIVGYFSDPINFQPAKIDINPRSIYMGITHTTHDEDKKTYFREDLENDIAMFLGGMAAEELYYGSTTTGVASDIQMATSQAINIYKLWGMDTEIGPICLLIDKHKFPEIEKAADKAIQNLLKKKLADAQVIVQEHKKAIDEIAKALLEKEVLYSDEITDILKSNS